MLFSLMGLFLLWGSSVLFVEAEPSDDHLNLASAANWAIFTSNVELVKSLLQAGLQINEPVDADSGLTMLHCAAGAGNARMVRFLVDNGASCDVRDLTKNRPIDMAYKAGHTNVCQVLDRGARADSCLAGYPVEVLELFFTRDPSTNSVMVRINGGTPSHELLDWLKLTRGWVNAVEWRATVPDGGSNERIEDKPVRGQAGCLFDIVLERLGPNEYKCGWILKLGPLAGGWSSFVLRKEYGYWLKIESGGGES